MSQKTYFYDLDRDELVIVSTDADGVEFALAGGFLTTDVEQVVYQDPQKVQVTSDNADLFMDAVIKLQDEQKRELGRLNAVFAILEGLLDG